MELSELSVFLKTVQTGSLSRAARELGLPRATLGRRLERLEASLGTRLIRRTTRRLVLTEAGELLYQRGGRLMGEVEATRLAIQRVEDRVEGELKIHAPPMQSTNFSKMICAFQMRYPDLRLQVNHGTPIIDLIASGYDVAIRASPVQESGLIQRVLRKSRSILVASPGLLEKLGVPEGVADLDRFPCIVGFDRGEVPRVDWPLLPGGKLRVVGRLVTNDLGLQHEAVLAGVGIALLPLLLVQRDLDRGALVSVLEKEVGNAVQISVVYPERAYLPAKVRVFIEAVNDWVKADIP